MGLSTRLTSLEGPQRPLAGAQGRPQALLLLLPQLQLQRDRSWDHPGAPTTGAPPGHQGGGEGSKGGGFGPQPLSSARSCRDEQGVRKEGKGWEVPLGVAAGTWSCRSWFSRCSSWTWLVRSLRCSSSHEIFFCRAGSSAGDAGWEWGAQSPFLRLGCHRDLPSSPPSCWKLIPGGDPGTHTWQWGGRATPGHPGCAQHPSPAQSCPEHPPRVNPWEKSLDDPKGGFGWRGCP